MTDARKRIEERKMTRTGTSYFVSFNAACKYYGDYGYDDTSVKRKIDAGKIHIGRPPLKEGEKLYVIDGGTRYAIESE